MLVLVLLLSSRLLSPELLSCLFGSTVFTHLPRALILGNQVSATFHSRKPEG
jgi:hypothetical protein